MLTCRRTCAFSALHKQTKQVKAMGLAKAVGVSNFGRAQLEALKETGVEMPEVNQVELHPWLPQNDLIEFHKANQMATMGYCPLARCKRFGETALKAIADKLGKTEAQVCIRWSLQMGFITIPKSVNAGSKCIHCTASTLSFSIFFYFSWQ